jgi:hypothetical protein
MKMKENKPFHLFFQNKKAYNFQIFICSYTLYERYKLMVSLWLHLYIFTSFHPFRRPLASAEPAHLL